MLSYIIYVMSFGYVSYFEEPEQEIKQEIKQEQKIYVISEKTNPNIINNYDNVINELKQVLKKKYDNNNI